MRNWNKLATTSHYKTAVAIAQDMDLGHFHDARQGLEELIEALSRSDARALRSYLTVLMHHIIKWRLQPERRSASWVTTIRDMRNEIADMRDENPRFNEQYILSEIWPKALRSAHNKAAGEMGRERIDPIDLAWHDVFEADDTLEEK